MKSVITLNWCPPAAITYPSPALSIIKGYLQLVGYDVDIIYWNIISSDLIRGFFKNQINNINLYHMYFIYNYLAIHNKNTYCYTIVR